MKKRYLFSVLVLLLGILFTGCRQEETCSHQFVTTVVQEATCSKAGRLNHICSLCSFSFTQNTPTIAHSFTDAVTKEPTCSEDGVITSTCIYCKTTEEKHIAPVSHIFDSYSLTPSCCTECGTTVEGAAADPRNPWYGKNWVAMGTSLTSEEHGTYIEPLVERTGLSVTNLGVPGGTAVCNILQIAQTAELSNADLITIEFGVNDWGANIPLGTAGDTVPYIGMLEDWSNGGSEEGTFAGACYQIFKTLQERAPKAVIIFLTESTGRNHGGMDFSRSKQNDNGLTQWNYSEVAMATARYMGIRTIDAGSKSMINQNHTKYLADHIHHTKLGGAQYALTVWSELKDIGPLLKAE